MIDCAIGSRWIAQSNAESPPPTITTSFPAYGAKLGTKNSIPRPSQPSPAGSGRGLNLPMPAVSPRTKNRWPARLSTTTGRIDSSAPARLSGSFVEKRPWNWV